MEQSKEEEGKEIKNLKKTLEIFFKGTVTVL